MMKCRLVCGISSWSSLSAIELIQEFLFPKGILGIHSVVESSNSVDMTIWLVQHMLTVFMEDLCSFFVEN